MHTDIAPIPPALADTLARARHVLVFTGAGVSAESGIATFRDPLTGLWARFDARALATPQAFAAQPDLVWGWYEWRRAQVARAQPNAAHHAIAALARQVPAMTLVTQNVDDLHERAGSGSVVHLHGSLHAPRCSACGRRAAAAPENAPEDEPAAGRALAPPACLHCGAPIRPGVVWFGESLPADAWQTALAAAGDCDLFLSIGTSALVHPAAELPLRALRAGATVAQVNPAATPLDPHAHFNLRGAAAGLLPRLLAAAGF